MRIMPVFRLTKAPPEASLKARPEASNPSSSQQDHFVMSSAAFTRDEMEAYLDDIFPEIHEGGRTLSIETVEHGTARVRMRHHPKNLRPGGTISGPAMMGMADFALYVAVLSVVGRVPLAVTTNLSINFLRKPEEGDLIAETRLLKAGKRLCVGEVTIFSEGVAEPVAHVTGTYSVPPR